MYVLVIRISRDVCIGYQHSPRPPCCHGRGQAPPVPSPRSVVNIFIRPRPFPGSAPEVLLYNGTSEEIRPEVSLSGPPETRGPGDSGGRATSP